MLWPFSKLFEESYGVYKVRKVDGKSMLFQRCNGTKGMTASWYKVLTFAAEKLTEEQKERWLKSVAEGEPVSVFTERPIKPDGPMAAMFHVLAKRR